MAERNITAYVTILHTKDSPSGGKFVTCLSNEYGLIECFLFGGSKSKYRSLVLPWHTGRIWLYKDSKHDLKKICDFDPECLFAAVRSCYESIMLANWASELMIKTHGLGGTGFSVMQELLTTIEAVVTQPTFNAPVAELMRACKILFGVKVLNSTGYFQKTYACEHCTGTNTENSVLYYSQNTMGFVCEACSDEGSLPVQNEAVKLLFAALEKPMYECLTDVDALTSLEASVLDMLGHMLERPLFTSALL
ncbi:MAG TPA: DNA repair protein RecO C-terminal domain-containing protein [Spirochaetales bacterium]|nr:DNA repair protein RecO C-terminal domain-containing protein [Spirochaetales bacterium]HOT59078.1 DNA repair protein RecO C-terminal domain-containing protein [Spirochaetales bacterium]HQK34615.1 DNA repair protein RecO C-terminal domain-containing protein [Spirochaetales bacterium]